MKAQEIYYKLKAIVEPIHAHSDQLAAIAHWIESESDYNPSKKLTSDCPKLDPYIIAELKNIKKISDVINKGTGPLETRRGCGLIAERCKDVIEFINEQKST
jgi:hypothetical protein